MAYIRCVVERVIYTDPRDDFAVIAGRSQNSKVVATGTMAGIRARLVVDLYGEWREHPKYGNQFLAERCVVAPPASKPAGIKKYLMSEIPGIGEKYAGLIVDKFGNETLEILEKNPEKVLEIKKIGKKKGALIVEELRQRLSNRDLTVFMLEHGIGLSYRERLVNKYGDNVIRVITHNPYCLIDDIEGIGFIKADTIASNLGIDKEDELRLSAGIKFTLSKATAAGHCFLPRNQLILDTSKILKVRSELLPSIIDDCVSEGTLVDDNNKIYLHKFYYAENVISSNLSTIFSAPSKVNFDSKSIREIQKTVERSNQVSYNNDQSKAIQTALSSKVMVLTGGPGTGKTTTILGIIAALQKSGCDILLAAPTGRAAKRMTEATGYEAKTIHRLLRWEPEGFYYNESNKLEGDAIIVDEFSMVDVLLMKSLIVAVPRTMKIIFVGDADQLPSVGPGNVLHDIIESRAIPVVHLKEIFRQAQDSKIIENAHKINEGKLINLHQNTKDFVFVPTNLYNAKDTILHWVDCMAETYNLNPLTDIQVLSPMKKGIVGTGELNGLLQNKFHNTWEAIESGELAKSLGFVVGDKVMQIRNNYKKDVFNGDIGFVSSINPKNREHFLDVSFGDRVVEYSKAATSDLILAYASTIHKSQGSEYPVVIIPMFRSHYIMLQRNLLYTAVTRAKQIVILVGEADAVNMAIRNAEVRERNTQLAQKLRDCVAFAKEIDS